MNDFTRDELEILNRAINKCAEINEWPVEAYLVADKIKSMIDNYCEHEPEGDYHVCVDKCKKCGEIVK